MKNVKNIPLPTKGIIFCQLRDSDPRPFGIAPEATALDRSAKLT